MMMIAMMMMNIVDFLRGFNIVTIINIVLISCVLRTRNDLFVCMFDGDGDDSDGDSGGDSDGGECC